MVYKVGTIYSDENIHSWGFGEGWRESCLEAAPRSKEICPLGRATGELGSAWSKVARMFSEETEIVREFQRPEELGQVAGWGGIGLIPGGFSSLSSVCLWSYM